MWHHWSLSTLVQAMACCLTATSHCLNQCWLFISRAIHLRVISQKMHKLIIFEMPFNVTNSKIKPLFPEANELKQVYSLKRKCRHFDEIFITGCTGSCHVDNFQCSQWWKFPQNEDVSVWVFTLQIISQNKQPFWVFYNQALLRGQLQYFYVHVKQFPGIILCMRPSN